MYTTSSRYPPIRTIHKNVIFTKISNSLAPKDAPEPNPFFLPPAYVSLRGVLYLGFLTNFWWFLRPRICVIKVRVCALFSRHDIWITHLHSTSIGKQKFTMSKIDLLSERYDWIVFLKCQLKLHFKLCRIYLGELWLNYNRSRESYHFEIIIQNYFNLSADLWVL